VPLLLPGRSNRIPLRDEKIQPFTAVAQGIVPVFKVQDERVHGVDAKAP
jgi:hypothetical protein